MFGLIVFAAMGAYGGYMAVVERWWRTHSNIAVLKPFPGAIFAICAAAAGMDAVFVSRGSLNLLVTAVILPIGIGGNMFWFCAYLVEVGSSLMSATQLPIAKTFDQADAMMTRREFERAESAYRVALAEEPENHDALMRLCTAIEATGRYELMVGELRKALAAALEQRADLKTPREVRQQRILRITYRLGDTLVEKLDRRGEARQLYESTLEVLYGFPEAGPLRDRLKALDASGKREHSEIVAALQPRTVSLRE